MSNSVYPTNKCHILGQLIFRLDLFILLVFASRSIFKWTIYEISNQIIMNWDGGEIRVQLCAREKERAREAWERDR